MNSAAFKVGTILPCLAIIVLAGACSRSPGAPYAAGVCWRVDAAPRQAPNFTPISSDAPSLLSCAADLEIVYLTGRRSVIGAYQGRYIFIGPAAIESAERLDMIRYPVFNKLQRAVVDRQLEVFLAAQAKSAGTAQAPPKATAG